MPQQALGDSRRRPLAAQGQSGAENGVVKLRCRPVSIPLPRAIAAARAESAMKTIALTEETLPRIVHSSVRSVVS